MLLSSIGSSDSLVQLLIELIMRLPAVILAISFHEAAHGYIAYKCGDPTAKMMGRVTMNPVAHFDLIGTLSMLLAGFGWAKPVVVNSRNFRHIRLDSALVALAGPMANFIMAFVAALVYRFVLTFVEFSGAAGQLVGIAANMVFQIVLMNISLMIFNLIPIPPLDGSKVLFSFLPAKAYNFILKYERYGFLILFVVIMVGILDIPISMAMSWVLGILFNMAHWIFSVFGLF